MQGRVWIALSHTVGPAGLTVCEPVYRDPTQKDKISKAYPEGVSEVSRYPCLDLSYVKGSPGPPPKGEDWLDFSYGWGASERLQKQAFADEISGIGFSGTSP